MISLVADAGCWIDKKRRSLFYPVSRDQNPVSADLFDLSVLQKLDTNFKILAYIDG